MFGRKKMKSPHKMAKINSRAALKRTQAQNYMIQVETILKNFNVLITSHSDSVNTQNHFKNEKDNFIRAVKTSDEYKENQKTFDKIIAAAQVQKETIKKKKPASTKASKRKR